MVSAKEGEEKKEEKGKREKVGERGGHMHTTWRSVGRGRGEDCRKEGQERGWEE